MKPYTYLLINFFTVVVCFIASFDKRIRFYRQFPAFLKASTIVALPFIAWDIWFTAKGVWWFDPGYTLGITIAGLPVEEWMFFWCIPFSCVFTYFCLERFFRWDILSAFNNVLVFLGVITCTVTVLLYPERLYTMITALMTTGTLIFLHFIVRVEWIGKASLTFTILMLGFFPVNGILTGTGIDTPIVNYNNSEFLGIRMLTIPIEDAVYGYSQFLLNIYFFKLFQNKLTL